MISVDDAGLWMRRVSERLAEQAFGRCGIAQSREHEVDRGTGGIDGSIEVARVQLNKGTKSVTEIGPHCGAIYGLRAGAESSSGLPSRVWSSWQ